MKRKYLVPSLLCMIFIACKKEPALHVEKPNIYWGTVTVDKNGAPWTASPSVSIHTKFKDKINLSFTQLNEYGFEQEQCSIIKVPLELGTYSLHNTSIQVDDSLVGSNFFFTDADLLLGYYNVLEADSSSFITIASYDPGTKELKGSFSVIFKVAQSPFPGAPDTIRLQNGVFHTKIIE